MTLEEMALKQVIPKPEATARQIKKPEREEKLGVLPLLPPHPGFLIKSKG
jgi:hypothetical protein